MAIQLSLLEAVQAQPLGEVIRTVPLPLSELKETLLENREYVQRMPSWVMVKTSPPIVRLPTRKLTVGLASTVKETVLLPLPVLPEEILIQLEMLEADQLQPSGDVMLTLPLPPSELNEELVEDRE